jgi:hypothetical protein
MAQFSQTIGAFAPRQVDTLAPAVVRANVQPLVLDIELENDFVAEYPRIHSESTAQEMLAVEIGKGDHRVG